MSVAIAPQKWLTKDDVHWSIPLTSGQIAFHEYMDKKRYHGKEYYLLFLTCYIDAASPNNHEAQAFRTAWKALRYTNPVIAAEINDTDLCYRAATTSSLESWADSTFVVLDTDVRPEEQFSQLPQHHLPQLFYFPKSGALSLRISHWRASLLGLSSLMDRLLDLSVLASPQLPDGNEVKNLTIPYEYQFQCFANSNAAAEQRVQDMLTAVFTAGPGTGLLPDAQEVSPEPSRTTTMIMSKAKSNELLKAAKNKGFKIAPLFHAALTQTVWDLEPLEFKDRPQLTSVYRDHRRFHLIPTALSGSNYADQNLIRESLVIIGRDLPFPALIDHYMKIYHTDFDEQAYFETFDSYAVNFIRILANLPHPRGLMSSLPRLSSLGVLDEYLKRHHEDRGQSITVKDVTLQAENPTTENTFWPHTWNGRLRITSTWNPAFYDEDLIQKVFASIFKYVGQGVGIKAEYSLREGRT